MSKTLTIVLSTTIPLTCIIICLIIILYIRHKRKQKLIILESPFPPQPPVDPLTEDEKKEQTLIISQLTTKKRLNPIARTILCGVYDPDNIWYKFSGMLYMVKKIMEPVLEYNKNYFKQFIMPLEKYDIYMDTPAVYLYKCGTVEFPKGTDININMMPFIMSNEFKKTKLPQYCKPYWNMIYLCLKTDNSQFGKIGYLTIHESWIEPGKSQRRPGMHIEAPGNIKMFKENNQYYTYGGGDNKLEKEWICNAGWPGWGRGVWMNKPIDGIYMCSNIDNSTAMWNCHIGKIKKKNDYMDDDGNMVNDNESKIDNDNGREVINKLGDIEHLRNLCNNITEVNILRKNTMYWFTDRTPHESLKINKKCYRQFFRIVTHKVSVWYEEHSTKNPNGVVPDKDITIVLQGSKFDFYEKNKILED